MNVKIVAIGFESGSQKVLDYLKKKTTTVEMNRNSIQLLKKYNIGVDGLFMINTPGETADDMMKTLKFIQENPIDTLEISITTAFPGTELWEYAKNEGFVSDDMDWNMLNTHIDREGIEGHKMLLDKDISRDDFKRIYDLIMKEQEKRNCLLKFKWSDILSLHVVKLAIKNPKFAAKSLVRLLKKAL